MDNDNDNGLGDQNNNDDYGNEDYGDAGDDNNDNGNGNAGGDGDVDQYFDDAGDIGYLPADHVTCIKHLTALSYSL
jgi:hypothetical protein